MIHPNRLASLKKKAKQRPTGVRNNKMTQERWNTVLQQLANGASRDEALAKAKITRQTLQAYLLSEPGTQNDLRTADLAWIRRDWPVERIDEFLLLVAGGKTNADAAREMGFMENELNQLLKVIIHDPEVKDQYDEARKLQCESWADEMIQISNDGSNDTYQTEGRHGNMITKVDNDVVNRSRLRIETRKWLMARLHFERFGDRMQQDIKTEITVNHSEILDDARKRKERGEVRKTALTPAAVSEDTPANTVH